MASSNQTVTFRKAQGELLAAIRRNGHVIEVPKTLTENWQGTCKACGKTVLVRFDVPCGYLVAGTGVMFSCHVSGRGF